MSLADDVVKDAHAGLSCLVLARNLDHVAALAKAIEARAFASVGAVEVLKGGHARAFAETHLAPLSAALGARRE